MPGFFKRLFGREPQDAAACMVQGDDYFSEGKLDRAIAKYTKAIRCDDPEVNPFAYNNRGYALILRGHHKRGIADCSEAIRLYPEYALAFINRGIAYSNLGELNRAIDDLTEAIRLDPQDPRGPYNRGVAYCDLGRFDAALRDFKDARRLDRETPNHFYDRGTEAIAEGDLCGAVSLLDLAVELDPQLEQAWCNRGFAHFRNGELDKALADYTQAVRLDPKDSIAYRGRLTAYRTLDYVSRKGTPIASGGLFNERCMFRFIVYYSPRPATEPLPLLRTILQEQFPQLTWTDTVGNDVKADYVTAYVDSYVDSRLTEDSGPLNIERLRVFGRGITERQAEALQHCEKALVLGFDLRTEHVWERMEQACGLTRAVAQGTGGVIWDEETRLSFSPEAWRQWRLGGRAEEREIAEQITSHCYEDGPHYRIITLGMAKFGLPDVVANDCPEPLTQPMADLISLVCLRMAKGDPVGEDGAFVLAAGNLEDETSEQATRDSLQESGEGKATLVLVREDPQDGDPDNRIVEIAFDRYAGKDLQERRRAMLAAVFGDEDASDTGRRGRHPDVEALVHRGAMLVSREEYDRAVAELTEAIRLDPTMAGAYVARGNAYDEMGNRDAAIRDYTEAIRLDPTFASAYYNRAVAYGYKGDDAAAIEDYNQAIALCPTKALYYASRSVPGTREGNHDAAISDCTKAIEIDPNFAPAYNNRADAYVGLGRYDEAIADYTQAIRLDPSATPPYAGRGNAYEEKGEHDRAIADYTEALRIDPKDADGYYSRGCACHEKGDTDRAIQDYTEAIQLQANYHQAYVGRANAYADKRDFARAIADFEVAIRLLKDELAPGDARLAYFYVMRGTVYGEMDKHDKAVADFTEAIHRDPPNAAGYFQRAKAYRALGENAKATEDYRKYEQLQSFAQAAEVLNSGVDHSNKGDFDKAIALFSEAIQISPDFAVAYYNRAGVHVNQGDFRQAIVDFTEGIQLEPRAAGYVGRGNAYCMSGELGQGIADFTEAIRLDPNLAYAYGARGNAYLAQDEYGRAIADCSEAIRMDSNAAMAYGDRGWAYFAKGKFGDAIKDLEQAIRLFPQLATAHNNLAWMLAVCPEAEYRDGRKAVEHATRACELSEWTSPWCLGTLAAAYAESGEFEQAVEWQTKAIVIATPDYDGSAADFRLELYKAGKPYRQER